MTTEDQPNAALDPMVGKLIATFERLRHCEISGGTNAEIDAAFRSRANEFVTDLIAAGFQIVPAAVPADQVAVVGDNDWQNYELVEELAIAIAEEDWDNLVGFHQDHLKTQVRGLLYEANERGYRMTRAGQTDAS